MPLWGDRSNRSDPYEFDSLFDSLTDSKKLPIALQPGSHQNRKNKFSIQKMRIEKADRTTKLLKQW